MLRSLEKKDPLKAFLLTSAASTVALSIVVVLVIAALGEFKGPELMLIALVSVIGSLAVVVLLYFWLRGLISSRVKEVSRFAQALADGKLDGPALPADGEGPIRELADSLNLVQDRTRGAVAEMAVASLKVRRFATNLAASAVEMNAASEEITATVQQISKGMETQAARTSETSEVMTRMSKNVGLMAEKSASVAEVSAQAWETALKGGESVK